MLNSLLFVLVFCGQGSNNYLDHAPHTAPAQGLQKTDSGATGYLQGVWKYSVRTKDDGFLVEFTDSFEIVILPDYVIVFVQTECNLPGLDTKRTEIRQAKVYDVKKKLTHFANVDGKYSVIESHRPPAHGHPHWIGMDDIFTTLPHHAYDEWPNVLVVIKTGLSERTRDFLDDPNIQESHAVEFDVVSKQLPARLAGLDAERMCSQAAEALTDSNRRSIDK